MQITSIYRKNDTIFESSKDKNIIVHLYLYLYLD